MWKNWHRVGCLKIDQHGSVGKQSVGVPLLAGVGVVQLARTAGTAAGIAAALETAAERAAEHAAVVSAVGPRAFALVEGVRYGTQQSCVCPLPWLRRGGCNAHRGPTYCWSCLVQRGVLT